MLWGVTAVILFLIPTLRLVADLVLVLMMMQEQAVTAVLAVVVLLHLAFNNLVELAHLVKVMLVELLVLDLRILLQAVAAVQVQSVQQQLQPRVATAGQVQAIQLMELQLFVQAVAAVEHLWVVLLELVAQGVAETLEQQVETIPVLQELLTQVAVEVDLLSRPQIRQAVTAVQVL
jgi:hypothetical protein